jgi:hypothetical protein
VPFGQLFLSVGRGLREKRRRRRIRIKRRVKLARQTDETGSSLIQPGFSRQTLQREREREEDDYKTLQDVTFLSGSSVTPRRFFVFSDGHFTHWLSNTRTVLVTHNDDIFSSSSSGNQPPPTIFPHYLDHYGTFPTRNRSSSDRWLTISTPYAEFEMVSTSLVTYPGLNTCLVIVDLAAASTASKALLVSLRWKGKWIRNNNNNINSWASGDMDRPILLVSFYFVKKSNTESIPNKRHILQLYLWKIKIKINKKTRKMWNTEGKRSVRLC